MTYTVCVCLYDCSNINNSKYCIGKHLSRSFMEWLAKRIYVLQHL